MFCHPLRGTSLPVGDSVAFAARSGPAGRVGDERGAPAHGARRGIPGHFPRGVHGQPRVRCPRGGHRRRLSTISTPGTCPSTNPVWKSSCGQPRAARVRFTTSYPEAARSATCISSAPAHRSSRAGLPTCPRCTPAWRRAPWLLDRRAWSSAVDGPGGHRAAARRRAQPRLARVRSGVESEFLREAARWPTPWRRTDRRRRHPAGPSRYPAGVRPAARGGAALTPPA
jgi:hypothetical protein